MILVKKDPAKVGNRTEIFPSYIKTALGMPS